MMYGTIPYGTLGGLHANGEKHHEQNGGREAVLCESHEDAKNTLERLHDPESPKSAAHSEFDRHVVRHQTTDGSGKDVHEAIARSEGTSRDKIKLELIIQVRGHDVVHSELDTEAETIRRNHAPHAVVSDPEVLCRGSRLLLELSRGVKELEVAVRKILADEHHSDAHDGVEKAGHKVSPSPRGKMRPSVAEVMPRKIRGIRN